MHEVCPVLWLVVYVIAKKSVFLCLLNMLACTVPIKSIPWQSRQLCEVYLLSPAVCWWEEWKCFWQNCFCLLSRQKRKNLSITCIFFYFLCIFFVFFNLSSHTIGSVLITHNSIPLFGKINNEKTNSLLLRTEKDFSFVKLWLRTLKNPDTGFSMVLP